jgi:hypothetical protein
VKRLRSPGTSSSDRATASVAARSEDHPSIARPVRRWIVDRPSLVSTHRAAQHAICAGIRHPQRPARSISAALSPALLPRRVIIPKWR